MLGWEAETKGHNIKTKDGFKKHIYKEGSREHVLSWNMNGTRCSERDCVVNHRKGGKTAVEDNIYL